MTLALDQVQSYAYIIASQPGEPGLATAVADSPSQLIIIGGQGESFSAGDPDRDSIDPTHSKIVLGYIDVGETTSSWTPSLFVNGMVPSWFGAQNPGWPGLYTVQFWNPAWENVIFSEISDVIAEGYDGIFLDVLSADQEWLPGNIEGNPVNSNATADLAQLLTEIESYVAAKDLPYNFYLIGNNPSNPAQEYPTSLESLNGVMNETLFYRQTSDNGDVAQYVGAGNATYFSTTLEPLYKADTQNGIIFGMDYPPTTDLTADFQTFAYYTALGVIPSVNAPLQTFAILNSGPYMAMAVPENTVVVGAPNLVNFLSGGLVSAATLTGGNQGDYFIGGPGTNSIQGGAGNDTIYAHPASAGLKNVLDIQFATGSVNSPSSPEVEVFINGALALSPIAITSNYSDTNFQYQDIQINTATLGTITDIEIYGLDMFYTDSTHFSNVFIGSISYQGQSISLANGQYDGYPNSYSLPNGTALLNNNTTATFSGTTIPADSSQPADTSDTINGGGGVNTVVYRSNYANYSILNNGNGLVTVTTSATFEGPDTLTNIQTLDFSDGFYDVQNRAFVSNSLIRSVQDAYQGVLCSIGTDSEADSTALQIADGQTTLAAFESGLIAGTQAQETTLPALIVYDAFYGATENSGGLDYVTNSDAAALVNFFTPLHPISVEEAVYSTMGSWFALGSNNFASTYNPATVSDTTYIDDVYQNIFGYLPAAGALTYLLGSLSSYTSDIDAAGIGNAQTLSRGAVYGDLLWDAETAQTGKYYVAANQFLQAAANGTVTYGPELTSEFPPSTSSVTSSTTSSSAQVAAASTMTTGLADPTVITITGSGQMIDPGVGSYTMQFLAGTSGDSLVLHANGVDQVYGFDPSTDVLDLRSVLTEANISLNDITSLGDYIGITTQGSDALIKFDPTGKGNGATIAVMHGLGASVTGLEALVAQNAAPVQLSVIGHTS